MADFSGQVVRGTVGLALPIATPELAEYTAGNPVLAAGLTSAALSAPMQVNLPVSVPPQVIYSGQEVTLSQLWSRVHVIPRSKDVGFVLSQVQFNVEVWNAYRVPLKTILSADVTGPGGLFLQAPASYPIPIAPLHARNFTGIVPQDGDPQIKNVAVFVILGEMGADLTVTGIRITVFSPDPDWSDDFRERTEYLTHILATHAGQEQRIQLRKTPRTRVIYRVVTMEKRDSAALEALLWGNQARVYGVPFWPDAQPLLANVSPGATVVQVTTTYRKFAAGGLLLLWRDMHTHEALGIQSVAAGSVTLSFPAVGTWPADGRTYVIPLLTGRLSDGVPLRYLGGVAIEMSPDFACEVA